MLSPDPGMCMIHPCKRPVGVCHLCLRDRLIRLSLSGGGESSSGHTFPQASSRSSFDSSSCSKAEDSSAAANPIGKLGTIFSLMESDNDEDAMLPPLPPQQMLRSKSLSQWNSGVQQQQQQQPRRSTSTAKDSIFSRFPAGDPRLMQCEPEVSTIKSRAANGFFHSPLRNQQQQQQGKCSTPGTPLVQIDRSGGSSGSRNGHFSWISSLFRKRKKKSSINSGDGAAAATETNFFPPDPWSDASGAAPPRHSSSSPPLPPLTAPPLWRSRSVSSGRILKKSAATAAATPTVSSLIAVDLQSPSRAAAVATVAANKVVDNALYDMDDDVAAAGYATRGSVASLMDVDHPHHNAKASLPRSSSTGKWRKRIRGESPSSVLSNPTATSDWSFYLTPLRTFRRR